MTKDKKMNRDYTTKEYSKFRRTRGNRPIDPVHVERIKKSIAAKDLKLPIYVTKDMEIREGHHTYEARKSLGLDIFYIVIDSEDALDMAIFNAGRKNWGLIHYLNFFCMRNKKDYQIVRSKMNQYGMPVSEALCLLAGDATWNNTLTENFKRGEFKIPAGGIAKFDKLASEMMFINNVYNSGGKLKRAFIRAMIITQKHPKYDYARIKVSLKSKGSKLLGATSREDYIEQLDSLINGGLAQKSPKRVRLVEFFRNREFEPEEKRTIN